MDRRLTEDFFMLMEDQEGLEAVEDPRPTQNFIMLMEDREEEDEAAVEEAVEEQPVEEEAVEEVTLEEEEVTLEEEEVTLEEALVYLFQKYAQMREEFPTEECDWYEMDPEERTVLALEKVEEIFKKVFDKGDTSLEYPTLSDWKNVQFRPGYGIQPVEDSQVYLSRIWGDSLKKFLHVLDVMRRLLESNTRTTKRDIFYQHVRDFGSQREVDRLVSIAVAMLEVSFALLRSSENILMLTCLCSGSPALSWRGRHEQRARSRQHLLHQQ